MKLADCNLGKIVSIKKDFHVNFRADIGHIVGLTANAGGEVIPLILFACEKEPAGIHYNLLEEVKY